MSALATAARLRAVSESCLRAARATDLAAGPGDMQIALASVNVAADEIDRYAGIELVRARDELSGLAATLREQFDNAIEEDGGEGIEA